jgi:hypothetical protein
VTWRGRLDGEPMDLITLAETFPDGDPEVLELDGAHWLSSNAFVGVGDDADRIDFEKAKALLQRMNGVTRVIDGSYNPVSLTGIFEDTQGGVLIAPVQAFGTLTIFGRSRLIMGCPVRGDRFLAQGEHDADLDDAFRILGRPLRLLTWGDLYKVYEIVTDALGGKRAGEKRIVDAGWATMTQLGSFGLSANHPDISGDDARHARMPGAPPTSKAMSSDDAQRLVLHLTRMLAEMKRMQEA